MAYKKFKHLDSIQGGLSDEVFNNHGLQAYIAGRDFFFGYIGSSERTVVRDQIVEKVLRSNGMNNEMIAMWLRSRAGRHLMDEVEDRSYNQRKFEELVKERTKKTFEEMSSELNSES